LEITWSHWLLLRSRRCQRQNSRERLG
jgi:hypothetical protein